MTETMDAEARFRDAHLSHCFQGEHRHTCAYGDDECPAAAYEVADHPNDTSLDFEDRALALVRYLAESTDQQQLEQAREWACQMKTEMEN